MQIPTKPTSCHTSLRFCCVLTAIAATVAFSPLNSIRNGPLDHALLSADSIANAQQYEKNTAHSTSASPKAVSSSTFLQVQVSTLDSVEALVSSVGEDAVVENEMRILVRKNGMTKKKNDRRRTTFKVRRGVRRLSDKEILDKRASISKMERGVGGRIESAFETAKMKGEAAFVTFITAGYPTAEGKFMIQLF